MDSTGNGTDGTQGAGERAGEGKGPAGQRAEAGRGIERGTVDPALLALLVCPVCKNPVEQWREWIACPGCKRLYPVRDGVPVMLEGESVLRDDTVPE